MAHHISRRSFLRHSALAGTAILAGDSLADVFTHPIGSSPRALPADLAVVSGSNYYDATVRAVELMGGIQRFVPRGAHVGLLLNSRYTNPGTFVKPEIALAVIAMCHKAGAAQIVSLEDTSARYWRSETVSAEHREYLNAIRSPRAHRAVLIRGGVNLKEVDAVPDLVHRSPEKPHGSNLRQIKSDISPRFRAQRGPG
jgi:hypothetical protein